MVQRAFKAKRGRVVYSIIGGAFSLFGLAEACAELWFLPAADLTEAIWWGCFVVVGVFWIAAGWTMKIVTDEERISSTMFFWKKAIRWDELDHSVIFVLAEPAHPLGIKMYGHGDSTARITIYLRTTLGQMFSGC